jgi:LmbE family N-acetylglucosaminyl deacetylase
MNAQLADILRMKRPLSIRSVEFPPALKILALGPHPDDFDAIGITMRFFKDNGNRIHVGVIRTSSGVEDSYCSPATPEMKAALRDEEQRKSCRFFGLPNECLTFLDLEQDEEAQPTDTPSNLNRLRDFILSCHPDLLFLPHGNDTNSGHRVVYAMFRRIASGADYPIVAFLNKDPKTIGMRTDSYTEFNEEEAQWKRQLLRCHDSQHQRNLNTRNHGFDERILRIDEHTARELGIDQAYAEAFEMVWYGTEPETLLPDSPVGADKPNL